jgi:hypothetical protein
VGPRNSYPTYTVVHSATRQRKTSCGAQKQLSHLNSGPFGHPTKENYLWGPETAIPPTQWSFWPPDKVKLAGGPETAIPPYTVVHLATRQWKTSWGAQKQLTPPTQWSIWPPDKGKLAAGPRNSYPPYIVVHLATRRRKTSWGHRNSYPLLHSGPFGHPTMEN